MNLGKAMLGFLLVFICSAVSTAWAQDGFKRYPMQSGIIEYTYTGNQNGTEIVYFDQWGMREARYSNKKVDMMGQKFTLNTVALMDNDWIYTVDLDRKVGIKVKNTFLEDFIKDNPDKDLTKVGEKMLEGMGGVKTGTDQIAGKTCDVWETKNMNTTTCIWNGVPLRTEINAGPFQVKTVATKIQENAPVSEDKFKLPEGIQMTEGGDPRAMMGAMPQA